MPSNRKILSPEHEKVRLQKSVASRTEHFVRMAVKDMKMRPEWIRWLLNNVHGSLKAVVAEVTTWTDVFDQATINRILRCMRGINQTQREADAIKLPTP